jgi:hypothetical protein
MSMIVDSGTTRSIFPKMPNAAPEWQAGKLGWYSRELVVACPLEGLVRRLEDVEETSRHSL